MKEKIGPVYINLEQKTNVLHTCQKYVRLCLKLVIRLALKVGTLVKSVQLGPLIPAKAFPRNCVRDERRVTGL